MESNIGKKIIVYDASWVHEKDNIPEVFPFIEDSDSLYWQITDKEAIVESEPYLMDILSNCGWENKLLEKLFIDVFVPSIDKHCVILENNLKLNKDYNKATKDNYIDVESYYAYENEDVGCSNVDDEFY